MFFSTVFDNLVSVVYVILAFGITPLSPELPSVTLASHGYSNTCDDPVTVFTPFLVNFSHADVKAQVDHLYIA